MHFDQSTTAAVMFAVSAVLAAVAAIGAAIRAVRFDAERRAAALYAAVAAAAAGFWILVQNTVLK